MAAFCHAQDDQDEHEHGKRAGEQGKSSAAENREGPGEDGAAPSAETIHQAAAQKGSRGSGREEAADRKPEPGRVEVQVAPDEHRLGAEQEDRNRAESGHGAGPGHREHDVRNLHPSHGDDTKRRRLKAEPRQG